MDTVEIRKYAKDDIVLLIHEYGDPWHGVAAVSMTRRERIAVALRLLFPKKYTSKLHIKEV